MPGATAANAAEAAFFRGARVVFASKHDVVEPIGIEPMTS